MRGVENIIHTFQRYGGMMRTCDLAKERIYYQNIQKYLDDGVIEKLRYGYYRLSGGDNSSEAEIITRLFPDGILCMNTALQYYGYINDSDCWHLAVSKDSGKSRFNIDYPFVKPYYIEQNLLNIGMQRVMLDGTPVYIYDRDRLMCDCLRYRNRMDKEIFMQAVKGYINDSARNISHLNEYAVQLRVSKKARDLLAIWL